MILDPGPGSFEPVRIMSKKLDGKITPKGVKKNKN